MTFFYFATVRASSRAMAPQIIDFSLESGHQHRRFVHLGVLSGVPWCLMARTNIDLDEELVSRAMRRYQLESKKAAVDLALQRLVGDPMDRDEALEMEGHGWKGDLDGVRGAPHREVHGEGGTA